MNATFRVFPCHRSLCFVLVGVALLGAAQANVDPKKGRATVELPDVPPGDRYAISISNDDPLTVYSESITITEPA